jgi:Mn2+/Fe2+ NRAMP family transporter
MRSTIAYTTARILLFVAAAGLLYLVGARGLLLLGLALLVSGIASYVLLSRQRDAMSGAIASRLHGLRGLRGLGRRLDAGTRAEDDD